MPRPLRLLTALVLLAVGSGATTSRTLHIAAGQTQLQAIYVHNSFSTAYRSPFGAVPVGTPVTLRIGIAHGLTPTAILNVYLAQYSGLQDVQHGTVTHVLDQPLMLKKQGSPYDTWSATFTPTKIGVYLYRFQLTATGVTLWYAPPPGQIGGSGLEYTNPPSATYHLTSYAPGFKAVPWARGAVVYQIFPDRFFNGDPSNDRKEENPFYGGQMSSADYCSPTPVVHTNESDNPINNCDFFGGDLQGIVDKLPYLKRLGINTLYLTPIFMATSNHKYDTSDYLRIDPHFGTQKTFNALVKALHKSHMHLILDGVFNHTGADSVYFNKYGTFKSTGAYQSLSSPYYPWYTFSRWPSRYQSYSGLSYLPELNESSAVKSFIFNGKSSVAQRWLSLGANGWRLDHAIGKSHEWWQQFRKAVKGRFRNDIIVGETVGPGNTSSVDYLLGNEMDGIMNYQWMTAVMQFFAAGGKQYPAISPTQFWTRMQTMLEELPPAALQSSMSLVDSHDYDRVTTYTASKAMQEQIAAFQMTWTGMPTIYYGDEAGLKSGPVGNDPDPLKRRFFPWSHQDTSLEAFYRKLITARKSNPALTNGSISSLITDDAHGVLGFLRKDTHQSVASVFNIAPRDNAVTIKLPALKNGTRLTDVITGHTFTVSAGTVKLTLTPTSEVILVPKK